MNKFIETKMNIINGTIDKLEIRDKLLKVNRNTIYTINDYIYGICFMEYCSISYKKFSQIRNELKRKIPSKSSLHNFNTKLKKYKIYEIAFNNNIQIAKDNEYLLIDSTFIENECCHTNQNFIDRNPQYKNKFGTKVTFITDEKKIPLYISIDSANKHDATIGLELLQSINKTDIANKTLLADAGYDSNKIKECLDTNECKYIIPKNKRNSIPENIKIEINEKVNDVKEDYKIEREKIVNKIKNETDKTLLTEYRAKRKALTKDRDEKIKKIKKDMRKNKPKNKEFNIGLTPEQKKLYKKRTRIEHLNRFIKQQGMNRILCKSLEMFRHKLYSSLLSMIIFNKMKNLKSV